MMTLNSSDQLLESLSAMVDNEASELEMRRILKNMESNPEMLERWRRYHLIGSVMRKEHGLNVANPGSLASSISRSLDGESDKASVSSAESASAGSPKLFRDLLGKTAIAASFAATLVLGFNFAGSQRNNEEGGMEVAAADGRLTQPNVTSNAAVTHAPIGFELPLPESRTVSMTSGGEMVMPGGEVRAVNPIYLDDITDYETQEMLNQLLIQHAERASAHGSLGIMPFARVHKMQVSAPAK